MTPTAHSYPFTRASVQAITRLKREPAWMAELRLAAWDVYEKSLATTHPETGGVALESMQAFTEPPEKAVPSNEWPSDLQHALEERGDEEGLVVQRDATILSRSISKEQAKRGVLFMDLDAAVKMIPDLVRRYFAQQIRPDNKWSALHTAFWSGGTFLYVPPHVKVTLPFHTCVWMSRPEIGVFPHTCIVVGGGSDVSFIDEMLSPAWELPGLSSAAVELFVGEQAKLQYFNLQNWGKSVRHFIRQETQLAGSSRLLSLGVSTGGSRLTSALRAELLELGQSHNVNVSRTFSLSQADYLQASDFFDDIFQKLPPGAMVEKLRHFIVGKYTGRRPVLTLEKVAQLHPEVRV